MRAYAVEVLAAWKSSHPDDSLFIVGPPWVRELGERGVHTRVVRRGGSLGRILAQLLLTPLVYWHRGADAVVALGPVVTPFVPRERRVCVVHDWRHKHHPDEFSRSVLLFRRLWVPLIESAGGVAAISEKALHETSMFAPRANPVLIESGRDHPGRWAVDPTPEHLRNIVTFGHRPAKRPELVLRAAALLPRDTEWRVQVLGASGEYREELAGLARDLGIIDRVELPGFVDDSGYRDRIAHAHVVVVASTDEGFGLPVVEARYFGAHAVATTDSGLGEIHGAQVAVVPPEPAALSSELADALARPRGTVGALDGATWGEVASRLRQLVLLGC